MTRTNPYEEATLRMEGVRPQAIAQILAPNDRAEAMRMYDTLSRKEELLTPEAANIRAMRGGD